MIILLGLAGSGKSTQGHFLAKKYNWQWISAGQLVRDSGRFDDVINKGNLVNHEALTQLLSEAFEKAKQAGQKVILDGYPRDLEQANWLIENYGEDLDHVFYIEVGKEELLQRIAERGRADDTEEALHRRFEIAEQNNCSILDLLRSNNIHVNIIDGSGSVSDVDKRIRGVIDGQ